MKKIKIKPRNIFAMHAWNRKGGAHKDKKWISKNRKEKYRDDE